MNSKASQRRRVRILADVLIALAVLTGLFFGGKAIVERTISKVSVPDIMGMNIDEAVKVLKQAGLKETHKFMANDEAEKNVVFKQNPEGSMDAHKGDTVILLVSSGPVPYEMPDVTGMTADEATKLLSEKK